MKLLSYDQAVTIPASFTLFSSFGIQLTVNKCSINVADDWNRTSGVGSDHYLRHLCHNTTLKQMFTNVLGTNSLTIRRFRWYRCRDCCRRRRHRHLRREHALDSAPLERDVIDGRKTGFAVAATSYDSDLEVNRLDFLDI